VPANPRVLERTSCPTNTRNPHRVLRVLVPVLRHPSMAG
jgi:hypothetical protein